MRFFRGNPERRYTNGDDLLIAEPWGSTLFGGPGNDQLYGDRGNDGLNGGTGADYLYGGGGFDTFFINYGKTEVDTIADFSTGDVIKFHGVQDLQDSVGHYDYTGEGLWDGMNILDLELASLSLEDVYSAILYSGESAQTRPIPDDYEGTYHEGLLLASDGIDAAIYFMEYTYNDSYESEADLALLVMLEGVIDVTGLTETDFIFA